MSGAEGDLFEAFTFESNLSKSSIIILKSWSKPFVVFIE